MTSPAPLKTTQGIQAWLRERVAGYVDMPVAEIRLDVRLVEYGMDSLAALMFSGEIEDEYGIEVPATMAWDHPTITAITELLSRRLDEQTIAD
ncbi:acyl carrier protein (plasmid) [Streptomyces sp. NBC_00440]|uniref:acyl carrier protein n=1 Tax=unclassified Streptomyces TaxID=2593676 RepID=UPI002E1FA47E|nr:acyl carrier protein [Streptomyces sp. NBC_00963]